MPVVDIAENPVAADPAAEAETSPHIGHNGGPPLGLAVPPALYLDKLEGVPEIAEFLYGDRSEAACHRVYHLAGRRVAAKRRLPTWRLGHQICARKSTIIAWIEHQEAESVAEAAE